jgi:hypothetical protein
MKTSSLAVMTLAVLALALSGCTTTEPGETESGCTPKNAGFEFDEASVGEVEVLGVQLLEYTDGATQSTMETEVVATDAGFPDSALETLGVTEEQLETWHAELIAAARDSHAVAEGFEASAGVSEKPYVEITTPEDGRYVVTVMGPLVTVPVTITCGDQKPVAGELVGVDPESIEAVPLLCIEGAEEEVNESLQSATTREYCAKA